MENENQYPNNNDETIKNQVEQANEPDEETEFENPDTDPGFATENELKGREDKREGNIDSNKSISEMAKDNEEGNDALNYKNDRENGAYNPKNI